MMKMKARGAPNIEPLPGLSSSIVIAKLLIKSSFWSNIGSSKEENVWDQGWIFLSLLKSLPFIHVRNFHTYLNFPSSQLPTERNFDYYGILKEVLYSQGFIS